MSALTLKLIALLCMTLDHIGYLVPSLWILRVPGRLAMPIYVYLLVNGYRHTGNRLRYAIRLAAFAVLSQLPFMLCFFPQLVRQGDFLSHGNMMLSLLIAFCCLWLVDESRRNRLLQIASVAVVCGVFLILYFDIVHTDYGAKTLVMVFVFYYLADHPFWTGVGMFFAIFHGTLLGYGSQLIGQAFGVEQQFSLPSQWTVTQIFALNALPLLRRYNGEKGWAPSSALGRKAMQLGFYAYYPVHLLVLFFLFQL